MSTLGMRIKSAREDIGMLQSDLAKAVGAKSSAVVSNWERDLNKPDAETLVSLCKVLNIKLSYLLDYYGEEYEISPSELVVIKKYRALDEHGKEAVNCILEVEVGRMEKERSAGAEIIELPQVRKIKRFLSPVSAGPGSHIFDDGFDEIEVPADAACDFAVRVSGDSMEPYIKDGEDILVSIGAEMRDGDVGIFFVDGSTYCKQYQESRGYVYLFSLNRARSMNDLIIDAAGGVRVECFGKVLLGKRPPLPRTIS